MPEGCQHLIPIYDLSMAYMTCQWLSASNPTSDAPEQESWEVDAQRGEDTEGFGLDLFVLLVWCGVGGDGTADSE